MESFSVTVDIFSDSVQGTPFLSQDDECLHQPWKKTTLEVVICKANWTICKYVQYTCVYPGRHHEMLKGLSKHTPSGAKHSIRLQTNTWCRPVWQHGIQYQSVFWVVAFCRVWLQHPKAELANGTANWASGNWSDSSYSCTTTHVIPYHRYIMKLRKQPQYWVF